MDASSRGLLRWLGAPAARMSRSARIWAGLIVALAALIASPIVVVVLSLIEPQGEVWAHLAATTLPQLIANTAWLVLGVGAGTALIGIATAWLVTMCRFPGSRAFEAALLLPLAMPAYIIAYAYADLLQFAGPVQSGLRGLVGWQRGDYWFPDIQSLPGAILMLTLVLYPYVYLLARAAFVEQSLCVLEVGRTLGRGPWACFFRLALPLARPAIAGGTALALMEAVADFGTVQYFGVDTFTTAIYRTWFGLGNHGAAAQLAAVLMLFVLAVLLLERWNRGQARYHHTTQHYRPIAPVPLASAGAAAAMLACALPVVLGFVVPALALLRLSLDGGDPLFGARFLGFARNSFTLATAGAGLIVLTALVLAYGQRLCPRPLVQGAARVAASGYAVPGSVIAVGVLIPFAAVDNAVDGWMQARLGVSTGLLLSGTLIAVLFAYLVRFLAVALNAVEAGLARISRSMDEAARTLGRGTWATLAHVHAPIAWPSVLTAAILVFVDILKELPATLIVRPFNFDTLAVRVYNLASDERLAQASTGALLIVAVSLLPVGLLSVMMRRARAGSAPISSPPGP